MNIFVDFSQLTNHSGGYIRYCKYLGEILDIYAQVENVDIHFYVRHDQAPFVKQLLGSCKIYPHFSSSNVKIMLEREILVKRNSQYLWIFPGNMGTFILPKKNVLVLHDLKYIQLPESVPMFKRIWRNVLIGMSIRRSKSIISISEFTRDAICEFYGEKNKRKVTVIRSSAEISKNNVESGIRSEYKGDYYLSILTNQSHKNAQTLIDTFSLLPNKKLILVSKSSFSNISKNVEVISGVTDDGLIELYKNAAAFLFPSLYEGQGLPVVEALLFNLPVICTDLPVLREMSLGEALFVDKPLDRNSWIDAINTFESKPACQSVSEVRKVELYTMFKFDTMCRRYHDLLRGLRD